MDYFLTTYKNTCNIGDIIQTIAMSRLVGPSYAVVRKEIPEFKTKGIFIANGWLRARYEIPEKIENIGKTIFCGVHTGLWDEIIPWLKSSGVVGTRDPWTEKTLKLHKIECQFIGCATLTLPRYEGQREGVYAVETNDEGEYVSHMIHYNISLDHQWRHGLKLLDKYRTAKKVYTSKLHCALPCIAFGTPVVVRKEKGWESERFGILESMGMKYGEEFVLDKNDLRAVFIDFLSSKLGRSVVESDPVKPKEIS